MYYIDTPPHRVDVFDFDAAAGTFHNRRPVVQIDPSLGSPDGMTIDAEGGLWIQSQASWNAANLRGSNRTLAEAEKTTLPALGLTGLTCSATGSACPFSSNWRLSNGCAISVTPRTKSR